MASAEENSSEISGLKTWLEGRFDKQGDILVEIKDRLTLLESESLTSKGTIDQLRRENEELRNEVTELRNDMHHLDAMTRRENLRFFNIPDHVSENTEDTLRRFITEKLMLDARQLDFSIVHRLGPYNPGQPRCILARFVRRRDINKVRAACSHLRGTKFGVAEDLPSEWAAVRRRAHHRYVKPAKENNKKIRWRGDRLFIDNQEVNLKPTPEDEVPIAGNIRQPVIPSDPSNDNNNNDDDNNNSSGSDSENRQRQSGSNNHLPLPQRERRYSKRLAQFRFGERELS